MKYTFDEKYEFVKKLKDLGATRIEVDGMRIDFVRDWVDGNSPNFYPWLGRPYPQYQPIPPVTCTGTTCTTSMTSTASTTSITGVTGTSKA